jgi:hypothetical protein
MNMNDELGSNKKVQVKSKAETGQCVRQHYQVEEPERHRGFDESSGLHLEVTSLGGEQVRRAGDETREYAQNCCDAAIQIQMSKNQ